MKGPRYAIVTGQKKLNVKADSLYYAAMLHITHRLVLMCVCRYA